MKINMSKKAFVIGMTVIGMALTGCSVLDQIPESVQHFDSGEKVATYTGSGYVLYKSEFDNRMSCQSYYYDHENMESYSEILNRIISRHDIESDCGKFGFTSDYDSVRENDLVFAFWKSETGMKCGINFGDSTPSNASEAQLWAETAKDILPSCSDVFILSESGKTHPLAEAE